MKWAWVQSGELSILSPPLPLSPFLLEQLIVGVHSCLTNQTTKFGHDLPEPIISLQSHFKSVLLSAAVSRRPSSTTFTSSPHHIRILPPASSSPALHHIHPDLQYSPSLHHLQGVYSCPLMAWLTPDSDDVTVGSNHTFYCTSINVLFTLNSLLIEVSL